MLIPQFTTRFLLTLTAALAAVSWVLASAVRGHYWAIGICSALGYLVVFGLTSGATLALVWAASRWFPRRSARTQSASVAPREPK